MNRFESLDEALRGRDQQDRAEREYDRQTHDEHWGEHRFDDVPPPGGTEAPKTGTFPIPITPTGAPELKKPWLLVHPDGGYSMGRDRYSGFGEWQKEMGLEA